MPIYQCVDSLDGSIKAQLEIDLMPEDPEGKPTWHWRLKVPTQEEIDAANAAAAAETEKVSQEAAEAAARAAMATKYAAMKAEKAGVKAMPRISAFLAKTKAEHKAEVTAITNLSQAKDVIEDLVLILSVLVKREFE